MTRRAGRERSEHGAVAILVAVSTTLLLIVAAMVLDFGRIRLDKQINKSVADSAAVGGVQVATLEQGGKSFLFRGSCAALELIKTNHPDLASLSGSWTTGAGADATGACNPGSTFYTTECINNTPATFARFTGSVGRVKVHIMGGYDMSAGASAPAWANRWPEDALISGDTSAAGGCDQIAVMIEQTRSPGLGSLATSADMASAIRSVARVNLGDGDFPVALLLLEQNDCKALDISGAGASILVKGTPALGSIPSSPGVIHADSLGNGSNCSSVSKIFDGNQPNGIVAEQSLDGLIPGLVTTTALSGFPGAIAGNASDPYNEVVVQPGPPNEPGPRDAVTRGVVDDVYHTGVQSAVSAAEWIFSNISSASLASAAGYKVVPNCSPTPAQWAALNISPADMVYVNCTVPAGFTESNVTIPAWRVVFAGSVKPVNLSLPNATEVYVYGDAGMNGVGLDASAGFSMHDYGNGTCGISPGVTPESASYARLFVRHGRLDQTNGTLRMCFTTVIMMGGQPDACVPLAPGALLSDTPCGGSAGSGVVKINGGTQEWNAPNKDNDPVADKAPNLEDLAFWSETYGAGPNYQMAGGGAMKLRGVFMVPNADPFNVKGGSGQDIEDSQYIVRKLNVTGTSQLIMQPSADLVRVPPLPEPRLVR